MIAELILRRRKQILVHSCLYYRLNTSLITDRQFDEWAYELVELQEKYPEISKEVPHAAAFEGFDGSTGYDLPYSNIKIVKIAESLIKYNRSVNR